MSDLEHLAAAVPVARRPAYRRPARRQPKSAVTAFLLTLLFGPFGMFYSTVAGAVVMLIVSAVAIPLALAIGVLPIWPICIIWATLAAIDHNARLQAR